MKWYVCHYQVIKLIWLCLRVFNTYTFFLFLKRGLPCNMLPWLWFYTSLQVIWLSSCFVEVFIGSRITQLSPWVCMQVVFMVYSYLEDILERSCYSSARNGCFCFFFPCLSQFFMGYSFSIVVSIKLKFVALLIICSAYLEWQSNYGCVDCLL
jgi:hypothetical protein